MQLKRADRKAKLEAFSQKRAVGVSSPLSTFFLSENLAREIFSSGPVWISRCHDRGGAPIAVATTSNPLPAVASPSCSCSVLSPRFVSHPIPETPQLKRKLEVFSSRLVERRLLCGL
jgi:hypothetical protein